MADAFCATYEVVYRPENEEVEIRGEVWMLGRRFSLPQDYQELAKQVTSLIWCTYRKNFRAIGGTGYTSDSGWGCTMRCGQMLLAAALTRLHLGRSWSWTSGTSDRKYHFILRMFLDKTDSVYSLQQIAQFGVDFHRKIGDWFGPNNICQVIRKLTKFDEWSNVAVHIAMDMTLIESEIMDLCRNKDAEEGAATAAGSASATDQNRRSFSEGKGMPTAEESSDEATGDGGAAPRSAEFRPLLLFIPLRLGLDSFEKKYTEPVKACLRLRQSVGMVGGRPRNAFWFYGCQNGEDGKLFYLDPHTCQPSVDPVRDTVPDESYHYKGPIQVMSMSELEPSLAVGFFCTSREELEDLFVHLRQDVLSAGPPIFEIFATRPRNMPALPDPPAGTISPDEESFSDLVDEDIPSGQHTGFFEEEFEMIEISDAF